MTARLVLIASLLLLLCPLGCFSFDRERNRRQLEDWRTDMDNFQDEFNYYFLNIDRPYDKPHRTDRSALRQAARDLRAARDDWDHFVRGWEREEPQE